MPVAAQPISGRDVVDVRPRYLERRRSSARDRRQRIVSPAAHSSLARILRNAGCGVSACGAWDCAAQCQERCRDPMSGVISGRYSRPTLLKQSRLVRPRSWTTSRLTATKSTREVNSARDHLRHHWATCSLRDRDHRRCRLCPAPGVPRSVVCESPVCPLSAAPRMPAPSVR